MHSGFSGRAFHKLLGAAMIWIIASLAAWFALNALVFAAVYFKPLPVRRPTALIFVINDDNIDQTWGR